jgi:hypothetical protein
MEMLKRPPSGRSSHTFPQGIIFEELEDCLGQSVTIIPLDEKTGLMVSYGFNDAAATRGDDRRTAAIASTGVQPNASFQMGGNTNTSAL